MPPMSDRGSVPFFIVGASRSGTTLLRLMLNRHPHLCIPPESHFITHLHAEQPELLSHDDFYQRLISHERLADWQLDLDALRRRIESTPLQWAPLFDAVFRLYADRQGKRRWGDKTPDYVRVLDRLERLFPQALFVHLVRDGRDVACSLLEVPWFSDNMEKIARFWADSVRMGRESGKRIGPSRYLELRYEQLIQQPEQQLQRVCDFLGEPMDRCMLDYHEDADAAIPPERRAWHQRVGRPVDSSRIGRWKTDLTRRQRRTLKKIAGDLLEELGYTD